MTLRSSDTSLKQRRQKRKTYKLDIQKWFRHSYKKGTSSAYCLDSQTEGDPRHPVVNQSHI